MQQYKVVIVDDELLAIELLERYVQRVDTLIHAGSYRSAIDALQDIRENDVDIVCLDIEMPGLSGMDLAKVLPKEVSVIFTTAHRHFAPEAFEVRAVDYLLKPIGFSRFYQAIERCMLRSAANDTPPVIVIRAERRDHFIQQDDIYYLEGLKDYTRYHTAEGKLLSRGSLGTSLAQKNLQFLKRIHRSYAVNPAHISAKSPREVLVNGVALPIGRMYRGVI
jgi:two-component system LytT family response regulator